MRSLKKYLAMLGIAVFILSVGQAASYAKTGLRPSDEEYIKECDLIVEGTIVAVDKTMLFASRTLAAKFDIQAVKVFKGKSLESLPKRLTVYQHVGGCIIGGEITQESRRRAQERYKKVTEGLFFLKKGSDNNYYLHFEDSGFKPASEENIKWLKNLLNARQESNNQSIPASDDFLPLANDLLPLAKQVLYGTNRIMSAQAGEMAGDPGEIVAFNMIYHSDQAVEIFKEVYKKAEAPVNSIALLASIFCKTRPLKMLKQIS